MGESPVPTAGAARPLWLETVATPEAPMRAGHDLGSGAEDDSFGPYTLMSPLGRGGMSTVFLASHAELPRPVAVKILHPHVAEDEGLRQRFSREASALAGLDHPNVLPVQATAASTGVDPYLVMMAADGGSLREEFSTAHPAVNCHATGGGHCSPGPGGLAHARREHRSRY